MNQIYVIGEDVLCCAIGERLARDILGWPLAQPVINKRGVTKLVKDMQRHIGLARAHAVLCIADTDRGCAKELRGRWLPAHTPERFLLRLAVPMIESWLMADHKALAEFFGVADSVVPRNPDDEPNAKRTMLGLARRSKRRILREEVVSTFDPSKPGTGYNTHLRSYVATNWRLQEAVQRSPSLARAVRRIDALKNADA